MGQKVNPNIFRLHVTKSYQHRYIEKKSSEISKYSFNHLEIEKFIYKFFKDRQLYVSNCKINYAHDGALRIFVAYFAVPEAYYRNYDNYKTKSKLQQKHNSYALLDYAKRIPRVARKKVFKKEDTERRKGNFRLYKRVFRNYARRPRFRNFHAVRKRSSRIVRPLFESISKFLKKKIKIFLTVHQLNKSDFFFGGKEIKFIKKSLAKLNRYTKNDFFKEGVNLLYCSSEKPMYAKLIAEFLANQLKNKKLKRHNFLFYFVKNCLKTFRKSHKSEVEGIKIKIKGRLNRRPRARYKTFKIGKAIPTLSISSKISYCEKVAFTPSGTIGIKVWAF